MLLYCSVRMPVLFCNAWFELNSCAGILELSIAMVEARKRQQKGASEQNDAPSLPETKPAVAGAPQV